MEHWELVQLDFQEIYGIDLSTPGLLRARSFRWLVLRTIGLLSTDRGPLGTGGSRVQRVLRPVKIEVPPTPGATP